MTTFPATWVKFEGPEGSGKTRFLDALRDLPYKRFFFVQDPTCNDSFGDLQQMTNADRQARYQAVAAERHKLMVDEIVPALQDGMIVLSDQSIWTSAVLASLLPAGDIPFVELNHSYLQVEADTLANYPSGTFLFSTPLAERIERTGATEQDWHEQLASVYDETANTQGWKTVDSSNAEPQMNLVLSLFDLINNEWELNTNGDDDKTFWKQISREFSTPTGNDPSDSVES